MTMITPNSDHFSHQAVSKSHSERDIEKKKFSFAASVGVLLCTSSAPSFIARGFLRATVLVGYFGQIGHFMVALVASGSQLL